MKKINVLVLGVGGNVSQGIIKAIAASKLDCRIVGACVSAESPGFYFCDDAYLAPYADSKNFLSWVIDLCNKERIDIVLTGVEENIYKIADQLDEFTNKTNALFICTPINKLRIGQDKLKTCQWLEMNDCNYPKYSSADNMAKVYKLLEKTGYPLIAKPRNGKGSKGIIKITDEEELKQVFSLSDYVIQEYIGSEDREYTVGCYRNQSGRIIETIILHRVLKNGTTVKAQVIDNDDIKNEALKICKKFEPIGPLNIQFRLDENNLPVCFELNVRFSGTTPVRAHFGFNDVEAMITEYVLKKDIAQSFNVRKGIAYRYMNEIYLEDDVHQMMTNEGVVKNIKNHKIIVEPFGVNK